MFVRRVICLLVTLRTPRICSVFAAPSVTRGLVGELAIVSGAICFLAPLRQATFAEGIVEEELQQSFTLERGASSRVRDGTKNTIRLFADDPAI